MICKLKFEGNNFFNKVTLSTLSSQNTICGDNKNKQLTWPGRIGASHMWWPSLVSLTPSTSLSGVRTSSLVLSKTLTLDGKAAISVEDKSF